MADAPAAVTTERWHVSGSRESFDDPLRDCLIILARLENRPVSGEALTAGLPLVDNRLTPKLFLRAAARAGFSSRLMKRPLAKISPLLLPAILLLKERRACILTGIDISSGQATVIFPETGSGSKTLPLAELSRSYNGQVLFLKPDYKVDQRAPEIFTLSPQNWFWHALFRSWRIYRDVLIASFFINLFVLATPFFILNVYDRVVPNNATETLWVLASGVIIIHLFEFVLRGIRAYFIDIAGKRTDMAVSASLMEKVLGLKSAARPKSVGAFSKNLQEFETIRDFITSASIITFIDLPFSVLFIAVVWLLAGPLALVPIIGMMLVVVYGLSIQLPLRHAVRDAFRASSHKNATLVESLNGLDSIKALGAESQVQRTWEQSIGYIAKNGVRARMLSASAQNFSILVQHITTVATIVYGVYLIGGGTLSLGGLIACVIIQRRAMSPMSKIANLSTRFHRVNTAMRTLNGIMQLPVERPYNKSFVHRKQFRGSIQFEGVNFRYPESDSLTLRNINLNIKAGEKVGIIGGMGAGKTTLINLILGLYEPTDGAVYIDGTDIRQIDPAELRRAIGYTSQEPMLFYGTVKDNILLGAPFADDQALIKSANRAGVTRFVNRHPLGFDMPVGEYGRGLSGGQKQSIAIARALLLDPPIILLDEPTSSMDNKSEQRLKRRLYRSIPKKTMLLVSHRTSLMDLVDRVIFLDNGRIIADGPRDNIIAAIKQGFPHESA